MNEYNTNRPPLKLKEYGRNIQKLVAQLKAIESKELRSKKVQLTIKLMDWLDTHSKSLQKRWDDLFTIADYTLDVHNPHPIPEPRKAPEGGLLLLHRTPQTPIKYKYYGRNIGLFLENLCKLPPSREREEIAIDLVKLMRRFGSIWNHESINNERIIADIKQMLPDGSSLNWETIRSIPEEHRGLPKTRVNLGTYDKNKKR